MIPECIKISILVTSLAIYAPVWAEEAMPEAADAATAAADKPAGKGVGPIEDVSGVLNKATALLSGNLEMEMELNKNKTSDEDYTYNAIGQRVPKATAVKSGGGLHSE